MNFKLKETSKAKIRKMIKFQQEKEREREYQHDSINFVTTTRQVSLSIGFFRKGNELDNESQKTASEKISKSRRHLTA